MMVTQRQHGHMQVNANLRITRPDQIRPDPPIINSGPNMDTGKSVSERETDIPDDPDDDSDDGEEEGEEGEGETQQKSQRPALTIVAAAAHGDAFSFLLLQI